MRWWLRRLSRQLMGRLGRRLPPEQQGDEVWTADAGIELGQVQEAGASRIAGAGASRAAGASRVAGAGVRRGAGASRVAGAGASRAAGASRVAGTGVRQVAARTSWAAAMAPVQRQGGGPGPDHRSPVPEQFYRPAGSGARAARREGGSAGYGGSAGNSPSRYSRSRYAAAGRSRQSRPAGVLAKGRRYGGRAPSPFVRCLMVALILWIAAPYCVKMLEAAGVLESRLPEYSISTVAAPDKAPASHNSADTAGSEAAEEEGADKGFFYYLKTLLFGGQSSRPQGLQDTKDLPAAWQTFQSGTAIKLYEYQSGQLLTLDLEEYVVGVVAGEMPASFHEEALKAQAVAARTYAVSRLINGASPALAAQAPQADITNDHTINQSWIGPEERQKRWGKSFAEYETKLRRAVGETMGVILLYEEAVIDPLYHASCGGEQTEASVNVWGGDIPYLQAVACSGHQDKYYNYTTLVAFADVDRLLGTSLSALPAGASLSSTSLCQVTGRSDSGRVLTASVLGQEFSGSDMRSSLGLPSANFQALVTADGLEVTSRGYGHGVGMCQYGADDLAQKGEGWQDILTRYYQGAYLAKMSPTTKS